MKFIQNEMKSIVDKAVKHYSTDLFLDFNTLKMSEDHVFYWLTYDSGTQIISESDARCSLSGALESLNSLLTYPEAKLYKIVVDKQVDGCFYGTIDEIAPAITMNTLKKQQSIPRSIKFKWDNGLEKEVAIPSVDFDLCELYSLFKTKVCSTFNGCFEFSYVF